MSRPNACSRVGIVQTSGPLAFLLLTTHVQEPFLMLKSRHALLDVLIKNPINLKKVKEKLPPESKSSLQTHRISTFMSLTEG